MKCRHLVGLFVIFFLILILATLQILKSQEDSDFVSNHFIIWDRMSSNFRNHLDKQDEILENLHEELKLAGISIERAEKLIDDLRIQNTLLVIFTEMLMDEQEDLYNQVYFLQRQVQREKNKRQWVWFLVPIAFGVGIATPTLMGVALKALRSTFLP